MRWTPSGAGAPDHPMKGQIVSARDERRGPRTRGRTALGRLPSTAAFDAGTKKSPLAPEERKLILFLLVNLADDAESLAEARQCLLDAYGDREGHWCAGQTKDSLTRLLAKSLGQGATSPPPWERIVEIVEVAVPPVRREAVLAQAAALFARCVGRDRPTRAYAGPVIAPEWIDEPVVTVEMIRSGGRPERAADVLSPVWDAEPVLPIPAARVPADASVPVERSRHPIEDPVALRAVLMSMSKTACELLERVEVLGAALKLEQTTNWQLRAENQRQRNLLEQGFREKYRGVSLDTIRQLITEQLRAAYTAEPPSPRPLHG
ncbi:hypothetical protein M8542_37135 [Amycolatopsis sp. OK19-0408]|uniref:Uncharacterized protein n=1 Tax=Amycolatopsis iheyensis TaxID=2945988 RepID=A0A9X2SNY4_9PSEU|nr:hypothetical protein [Amycolatopsis iheyensis]MCR6488468.1 hypothetical protein [Amycolatopsis iheyensis]